MWLANSVAIPSTNYARVHPLRKTIAIRRTTPATAMTTLATEKLDLCTHSFFLLTGSLPLSLNVPLAAKDV